MVKMNERVRQTGILAMKRTINYLELHSVSIYSLKIKWL